MCRAMRDKVEISQGVPVVSMTLQESVRGFANDRDRALVAVALSSGARGWVVVDGP